MAGAANLAVPGEQRLLLPLAGHCQAVGASRRRDRARRPPRIDVAIC